MYLFTCDINTHYVKIYIKYFIYIHKDRERENKPEPNEIGYLQGVVGMGWKEGRNGNGGGDEKGGNLL